MSDGVPKSDLPNVAVILASVLARIPREQQPLLIAYAERLAATRYRIWAAEVTAADDAERLRACAEREEAIAGRIEGLFPNTTALQRDLVAKSPELEEINRDLFAERPLTQQFAIQASGERLGATTWTAFADHTADATTRNIFLTCAELELESAVVLESILARGI